MAQHFLPRGRVLGCEFARGEDASGAKLTVSVEAAYGATRAAFEAAVEQADTLALLIRCCLEHNIPIPRRSVKTVSAQDRNVTLRAK